ncbi:hypothetical protein Egran_00854 [Elaphomyces granulatus]|uniref:Zn(2)-C6 fungal-type domain-containing protein n=1 Tax=Elaphomyces granulatus TaxID=519963 RepID=A0A232M4N5_9EURO|nr:hypothetical protein Egran_00854 [Elaphomyces granulatus]
MDSRTRLRKACDACSIRKVKCDESGSPCRSCASLDIPCTYDRPSRRRGPPNRHAAAFKRRKFDNPAPHPSTSPSTGRATVATQTSHSDVESESQTISGESICSLETLQLLVDDFFTYIHPLVPIPHEPTFRAAFARREDATNKTFLALLAGMIGTLVTSFPRRPRLHLKTEIEKKEFPNSISLVRRCHDVAIKARGPGYLDRKATVYDAATSYFLGLCAGYAYDMRRCHIYFGECVTVLRVDDLFKWSQLAPPITPVSASSGPFGSAATVSQDDIISRELGRRLFYVCLVGYRTLRQIGSSDGGVYFPLETPTDRYPPLPVEVDDEYIFSTHVGMQPTGTVSLITGFNANVRVFNSYNSLLALETAFGSGGVFDWERQKKIIWECLQRAKNALNNVPAELELSHPATNSPYTYSTDDTSSGCRGMQYEIQKANIYISQLSTRSHLVDRYWSLYEAHKAIQRSSQRPSPVTVKSETGSMTSLEETTSMQIDHLKRVMCEERGLVIKDLLFLLTTVNVINMEPNGASFTTKLRQVASTLLNLPRNLEAGPGDDEPATVAGPQLTISEAESYLETFIEILVRLEGITFRGGNGSSASNPGTSRQAMSYVGNNEEDIRHWACLKEHQRKFAEAGGVLSAL